MKTLKWLVSAGLMFTSLAIAARGFTIDGTAEGPYGSALSTQTLATAARGITTVGLDNDMGQLAQADGSELDAAYGFITNGTLYLVVAGNLDTGGVTNTPAGMDSVQFDKLHIFFMTGPGGDHTLGTNYSAAADFGHLNRMGVGGNGVNSNPGLTFDTGFAPNYWLGVTIGTNSVMSANYEVVCSNCAGAFLGRATPTNGVLSGGSNPFGIQVAFNNSNTNGVPGDPGFLSGDPAGCPTNAGQASVRTGVELAIPLLAIGSPTGKVSICAFITENLYDVMYNQVLGPVVTNDCVALFSLDGDPSDIDFSTLPGQHTFTIPVPPCEALSLNPTSASFPTNGGTGSVSLGMVGNCSWQATSSVSWVTITSATSGSGNATISYSVGATTSITPRTGFLTVSGGDGATSTVSIAQSAFTLPPLSSIIIDGTVDAGYGCPVAVQQISTSFGKNTSTNIMGAGGSELDAAYGMILNNTLFLALAGNIQSNQNRVMIFFMTGPGGQNTLTNVNPNVDNVTLNVGGTNTTRSVLSWMGPTNNISPIGPGPGLTFDPGFAPNYFMDVNCTVTQVFFSYAQLWPGGTNASGIATNGYFLGRNGGTNGTLVGGTNPFLIQATLNNSNTNGVDAGHNSMGCYTNALGVAGGEITQAQTVTTGIELGIPLAALGSPTGAIAVCAFVANQTGLQLSTQILGPFGTNDPNFCLLGPGRTTNSWAPFLVMSNYPGQHYFWVGPEVRITGVTVVGKTNVNVSYQTANNTNLLYQLQRTTGQLQTNSVWINVPGVGSVLGNGAVVTQTDPFGGTNKSGVFYRVRQTPNCP